MDSHKLPSPSRLERRILTFILCSFAILAALYSVYVPVFEASDELWHYPMVETIASSGTLPVQPLIPGQTSGPWRQEGSQPPLYYAIGAALTAWIDTSDMEQIRYLNPHVAAGEIRPDSNNTNLVVHNPAVERFPWKGTVLAIHLVRFYSVCLATWSVYLTWALVRELYPSSGTLALAAASIHAFTPMFLFISGSVNNDNLIIPLCTLALLWMVREIKYADPLDIKDSVKSYLYLGCVLASAVLTKASGIGLIPLVTAAIAWQVWQRLNSKQHELSLPTLFQELPYALIAVACVIVPVLVIAGWWFYRNYKLYSDILGLNAFYAVLGMRGVPADIQQLWSERFAFAAGYWGNFGGLNVPMPNWVYTTLNSIAILAAVGSCIAFILWLVKAGELSSKGILRTTADNLWPFRWERKTAARALSWSWPAAVFVSWVRWATVTWSSQGRLIFSAIPMWSLALLAGIHTLTPQVKFNVRTRQISLKNVTIWLFVLFLLCLCIAALPSWIKPSYTPPPIDAGEPPEPYVRYFDDVLLLRGYALNSASTMPGESLQLTLYWQAVAQTEKDHSIFIHLLGNGERIIAQRDTFPGHGLISTTWLQPGISWAETHDIQISPLAYTPDNITLGIGVYDTLTGIRTHVYDEQHVFQGEMILFEHTYLDRPTADIPNAIQTKFGQSIVLQGYNVSDLVILRGQPFKVTLYWNALKAIEYDYTISVQLIDENWDKAGQMDSWPMDGDAPTSTWVVGEAFIEQRDINIAQDADPGVYDLRIALYRIDESGELLHLPVVWQTGQMPASSVTLTRIRVE